MKKSFTMIELVVSVVILAILSTISALAINQRLVGSRDDQRVIDMRSIDYGLKTFYQTNNYYPLPSDSLVKIYASGYATTVSYQGNFGALNIRDLQLKGLFLDPLNRKPYTYSINAAQDKYELVTFLESNKYQQVAMLDKVYAGSDYSTYYPKIIGQSIGILLQKNTLLPIQLLLSGSFDVTSINSTYDAYLGDNDVLLGTGASLLSLLQFAQNTYDEPKACPAGFIPVPGNKTFQQPGFCVARYEMKQITGTAGYLYSGSANTFIYVGGVSETCPSSGVCGNRTSNPSTLLNGKIVSKADGQPIVWLNQATAISACNAMGSGYHLITNNEWMSISRNIEAQSVNWTLGKVGSGGIYRGKNYTRSNGSSDTDSTNLDCDDGTKYDGTRFLKSLTANANGAKCRLSNGRNKRELYLSNGQSIWDLAGNVYEHVNKANTINGTGYASGSTVFQNIVSTGARVEWSSGNVLSTERNLYGPSSSLYNSIYGMGKIYGNVSTNIFVRGGAGRDGDGTGIYFLSLAQTSSDLDSTIGFRCAY